MKPDSAAGAWRTPIEGLPLGRALVAQLVPTTGSIVRYGDFTARWPVPARDTLILRLFIMTAADVREWILVISASVTLVSVAISSWLALRQYLLKLKEEERLSASARAETDIKLVKAFSDLMDIAHGRSGHVLSEKAVEFLLTQNSASEKNIPDLLSQATAALPVGLASQDAAIAAIVTLGTRHKVLRNLARQGLESLVIVRPDIAREYLNQLNQSIPSGGDSEQTP